MEKKEKVLKVSGFKYRGYTKRQLIQMLKTKNSHIETYLLKIRGFERMIANQKLRVEHIKKQLDFLIDHPWAHGSDSRNGGKPNGKEE